MSLEEELRHIDHEIRRLKIQYDLYFIGALGRPPVEQRDTLSKLIRRYHGMRMQTSDRFLFNSLNNKFNAFQELWNRGVRNKEEGIRTHPLAARAGQKEAARLRSEAAADLHGETAAAPRLGDRSALGGFIPTWRLPVSEDYQENLRGFYENYLRAGREAGSRKQPSFEAFAREITRQAAVLKGRADCDAIEFRIYCQDNKVRIKAKAAK